LPVNDNVNRLSLGQDFRVIGAHNLIAELQRPASNFTQPCAYDDFIIVASRSQVPALSLGDGQPEAELFLQFPIFKPSISAKLASADF
jgi:hypothetical protein